MDPRLLQTIVDVAVRAEELRDAWSDAVRSRRSVAASQRWVSGDADGLLSALPLAARCSPSRAVGRWIDEPDEPEHSFAHRVHLDDHGRPLVHERPGDGYVLGLWRYEEDFTEEVKFWGGEPHVTWVLGAGDDAAMGAVGADLLDRWVQRWTWHNGRVARVDRASAAPGGWATADATEAILDADGEPTALHTGHEEHSFSEEARLTKDNWLAALDAALTRAAGLPCTRVAWTAALNAPADLRAEVAGLGASLADALAEAIVDAARASDVIQPFCVRVRNARDTGGHHGMVPPTVLLADDRWRRGMVASSPPDGDAVRTMGSGDQASGVVELDIAGRLNDDALRACAEFSAALDIYAAPADQARAAPVLEELADRLTALLGAPGLFPGVVDWFLPLIELDRYASDPIAAARDRAGRVLGRERVTAFMTAVRSQAPAREGSDAGLALRALTDRDALEGMLSSRGLAAHAQRLAHEVAQHGLLIGAHPGPTASRIGGPALLPPHVAWPSTVDGRPLSFLAAIDLAELPPRPGWPAAGWWLFFADLGEDDSGWGFFEPERNTDGARARLFYTPPGVSPTETETPDTLPPESRLNHQPIAFRQVLTLPDGYDAPDELGLDPFAAEAYKAVLAALWEALGERTYRGDQHWIGGHVTGAQGHTPEDGTELLLHLAYDDSLAFEFLDGGTIQFRIPTEALERGDYTAVEATPDSS